MHGALLVDDNNLLLYPLREPFLKLSTKNFTEIDNDCDGRNVGPQMQNVLKKSRINKENA
jgi:hypothetical protein